MAAHSPARRPTRRMLVLAALGLLLTLGVGFVPSSASAAPSICPKSPST